MAGPRASAGGTSFTAPLLIERNTLSSAATTTTIEVSGTATFAGDLNVLGRVSASSTQITGTLTVDALTVTGAANFGGAVVVTGAANFGGGVTVSATADFAGPVQKTIVRGTNSTRSYGVFGFNSRVDTLAINHSANNKNVIGVMPGDAYIFSMWGYGVKPEVSASATFHIVASAVGVSALIDLSRTSSFATQGPSERFILEATTSRGWVNHEAAGALGPEHGVSGNITLLAYYSAVGTQPTGGSMGVTVMYGHAGLPI